MTSNKHKTIALGLILILFTSCAEEKKDSSETRIREELERRSQNYLAIKVNNCNEEIHEKSKKIALEKIKNQFGIMNDSIFGLPNFGHKPQVHKRPTKNAQAPDPLFDGTQLQKDSSH